MSSSGDGRSPDWLPELFSRDEWRALAERLGLTHRQHQVARLICRGLTTNEIADEIGLTPHTIRMHKQVLFKRLRIRDRIGVPVRLVLAMRRISG